MNVLYSEALKFWKWFWKAEIIDGNGELLMRQQNIFFNFFFTFFNLLVIVHEVP